MLDTRRPEEWKTDHTCNTVCPGNAFFFPQLTKFLSFVIIYSDVPCVIKKQFHLSIQDFSKVKAYLCVQLWWIIYENSRFWSGHHTVVIHDVSLDFIILEEPRLILTANIQYLWTTYHDYYTILKKDTFMIWTYNFKISRSDLTNKTIHV